ncbi:MAG: DUF4412 domain-containing protein [Kiritimatiellae bacterium]|nr:DUF4412 domain-containing protein [Kiritimatiellia bacterium]
MKKYLRLILALHLIAAAAASAGVILTTETKDLSQTPPEVTVSRVSIDGDKLRMDLVDPIEPKPTATAIFRADRDEILNLDHATRTYMRMDKSAVDAMAGQISAAMQEMRAQLAELPPEQRAMAESMMGQMGGMGQAPAAAPSPGQIKKTAEQKDINGYPCVKYEVLRDGRKTAEVWVTTWEKAGIPKDTFDVFAKMADFYSSFIEALQQGMGAGMEWDTFAEFRKIDGYPVLVRNYDETGAAASITTFKTAKQVTLPPATFEVPAGYNEQRMPMGMDDEM